MLIIFFKKYTPLPGGKGGIFSEQHIPTINKMILVNKKFYHIFTNDIVWNNIFHQNFTKLRIIERPEKGVKSISEQNELGKKRKRFISAAKTAKNKNFTVYRPPKEDTYNVVITGYCGFMPLEGAIKDVYGPHQDIFSFFNWFFFYDEIISSLSFYSCPTITEGYTLRNTDWFLFAFNRNFPGSFKNFHKAEALVAEKGLKNVVLLENIYVPNDLSLVANKLKPEELEELKTTLELPECKKAPAIDDFISNHSDVTHIKVNICSNSVINEVFYTIIETGRMK